jgi:esterase/lipase superfamily enzyme
MALSGIYTAEYGFGGYMDDIVYQNSPVHYMRNLPTDHPYISMFNSQRAVICVGQGAWEIPDTTKELKSIFDEKGINKTNPALTLQYVLRTLKFFIEKRGSR